MFISVMISWKDFPVQTKRKRIELAMQRAAFGLSTTRNRVLLHNLKKSLCAQRVENKGCFSAV